MRCWYFVTYDSFQLTKYNFTIYPCLIGNSVGIMHFLLRRPDETSACRFHDATSTANS